MIPAPGLGWAVRSTQKASQEKVRGLKEKKSLKDKKYLNIGPYRKGVPGRKWHVQNLQVWNRGLCIGKFRMAGGRVQEETTGG